MARNLTQAQLKRRGAILEWLRMLRVGSQGSRNALDVRTYLAQYHQIFITVDTVAKDLRAMVGVESIESVRSGHENRWIATPTNT